MARAVPAPSPPHEKNTIVFKQLFRSNAQQGAAIETFRARPVWKSKPRKSMAENQHVAHENPANAV
jgi:hypothetical protein